MENISTVKESLADSTKNNTEALEEVIFESLKNASYFKTLALPCVILSLKENEVVLGLPKQLYDKITGNYANFLAQNEFDRIIKEILGAAISIRKTDAEEVCIVAGNRIERQRIVKDREAHIMREVERQKNDGKCDIIPFPAHDSNRKIRTELTIERHALFASNTFKGNFRTYEREMIDPETNKPVLIRLEVGDEKGRIRGVLKQKHQEVLYKLFEVWEDEGYNLVNFKEITYGILSCSVYELVKRLRADDAGHHYDSVYGLLLEMASIRVKIKKINRESGITDIKDFSLLSFEWNTKQLNEALKNEASRVDITFSAFVTESFLRKEIKPLMLKPYLALKDQGRKGMAQLLYTMLDYELASKDEYHISLSKLADRIGSAKYKFKSDQKRKIEPSIKKLNGVLILDGKYTVQISLKDSEKKDDFILKAKKIPTNTDSNNHPAC